MTMKVNYKRNQLLNLIWKAKTISECCICQKRFSCCRVFIWFKQLLLMSWFCRER